MRHGGRAQRNQGKMKGRGHTSQFFVSFLVVLAEDGLDEISLTKAVASLLGKLSSDFCAVICLLIGVVKNLDGLIHGILNLGLFLATALVDGVGERGAHHPEKGDDGKSKFHGEATMKWAKKTKKKN